MEAEKVSTSKAVEKLTTKDIVFYGFGGATSTMTQQFKNTFSMPFLTDIAGISIGAVGIWTSLMTLWDAVNDPLIGCWADRTNTKRFGKYRPHMIVGCIMWAIVTVLLFTVPNFSMMGKSVYYISLMCLFSIFSTQFTVPWQTLNSVMSDDPHQRNLLLVSRQFIAFITTALSGIMFVPIVNAFPDEKTGWLVTACLVGIVCVVCGLICADSAKKRDYYHSIPTPAKSNASKQFKIIVKNKAVICVAIMLGCVAMISTITGSLNVYYAKYVVKNMSLVAMISIATLILSVGVFPVMPLIMKKLGKIKTLFIGACLMLAVPIVLIIWRESTTIPMILISNTIYGIGFLMANVATLGMIPDCTDYTELIFGAGNAGFVNSVITFMRKVFRSGAALLVGTALGMVGYSVNPDSIHVVDMIMDIKIYVPIALILLMVLTLKFYPITSKYGKEMRAELHLKRTNSEN